MATFSYIARDATGQRVTGRLTASNEQGALSELHARELAPVRVSPLKVERSWSLPRQRVSTRRLANSYRQLADLLRSGVPLLRALRLLGRGKANPRLASVYSDVADAVADGTRLADALGAHREIFPEVHVAMIRAGERGGFLEQVLARLGEFLEHQADLRAKVVGNLLYPVLLLVVGLGVVVGALIFFVPKFKDFYARIDLPLPTRILLGTSDALVNGWLIIVLVIAVSIMGVMWLWRQPKIRRGVAQLQLRLPRFGALVRNLSVARFARILGTLLANGIPLLQALRISRDTAGHILLAESIDEATEAVRAGESLADPLASSGMFGDEVIEMISVGEQANNLPDVLLNIAETLERRIDRTLSLLLRLLEPLLLLGLAGVVMFIFIALVVPMLRMRAAI